MHYLRRRRLDHAIRHSDALRDFIDKFKRKLQDIAEHFKSLPIGRKIAFVIGNIFKTLGVLVSANGAGNIIGLTIHLKRSWKEVESLVEQGVDELEARKQKGYPETEMDLWLSPAMVKGSLKVAGGLLATIIGTVTEIYANHGVDAKMSDPTFPYRK